MMDVGEITASDDDGCRRWGGMYAGVVTTFVDFAVDVRLGQELSVSNCIVGSLDSVFFSPREVSTAGV
jgi:hypothetical protein